MQSVRQGWVLGVRGVCSVQYVPRGGSPAGSRTYQVSSPKTVWSVNGRVYVSSYQSLSGISLHPIRAPGLGSWANCKTTRSNIRKRWNVLQYYFEFEYYWHLKQTRVSPSEGTSDKVNHFIIWDMSMSQLELQLQSRLFVLSGSLQRSEVGFLCYGNSSWQFVTKCCKFINETIGNIKSQLKEDIKSRILIGLVPPLNLFFLRFLFSFQEQWY